MPRCVTQKTLHPLVVSLIYGRVSPVRTMFCMVSRCLFSSYESLSVRLDDFQLLVRA